MPYKCYENECYNLLMDNDKKFPIITDCAAYKQGMKGMMLKQ